MWPCTQFYSLKGLILWDIWARRFRPATAMYLAHFSQKQWPVHRSVEKKTHLTVEVPGHYQSNWNRPCKKQTEHISVIDQTCSFRPKAKMNVLHYICGYLHYACVGLGIVSHAPGLIRPHSIHMQPLSRYDHQCDFYLAGYLLVERQLIYLIGKPTFT